MCGIAGVARLRPEMELPDLRDCLGRMAAAMRHRGPDDSGVYVAADGRVGLTTTRLAIRDLSAAGHMPMVGPENRLVISYNGEIYNADELRPKLERLGYRFRSDSDTEVILHGYAAWGSAVVEQLRGMFAFAILDPAPTSGTPRLFLARDRLGIKPLYYTAARQAFVFASELKALLASGLVGREMSPAGLVGYLLLGAVPNPLTIYAGVQALEPGCTLTVALDKPTTPPTLSRYWSLPVGQTPMQDAHEAVAEVRALLEDSVRRHLVSDVPLGAFLSGGLDSSAIVALMRKATDGPIRTCSIVFEEATYSEAPYARAMAEAAHTEHYERVLSARDVTQSWDDFLAAMDQPTSDGLNTYFVSQTARQAGLTVALSGLGGDELFGGYPNTFGGIPRVLQGLRLAATIPGGKLAAQTGMRMLPNRQRWVKLEDALGRPARAASAYLVWRGLFAPREVQALVTPEVWRAAVSVFDPLAYIESRAGGQGNGAYEAEPFAWTSRAELGTYMHHQLLRDTDVMSMAHSLEVRVPFLDHRLVEYVVGLPTTAKVNGLGPKSLLLKALGTDLPAVITAPRAKQGFTLPFDPWLRGPLRSQVESLADAATTAGLLRQPAVSRVQTEFQKSAMHWSRPWALAVLGAWAETNQTALQAT